jgi:hypothetical protein
MASTGLSNASPGHALLCCLMFVGQAGMGDRVSAADGRNACDLIVHTGIVINRSRREVWPRFLNMPRWMRGVKFEPIEGEPGAVGEVRRVREAGGSSYLIKVVRIVPEQEYVVKVLPDAPSGYSGYAVFRFREDAGWTYMTYDIYVEDSTETSSNAAATNSGCAREEAGTRLELARNNRELKRWVEEGH